MELVIVALLGVVVGGGLVAGYVFLNACIGKSPDNGKTRPPIPLGSPRFRQEMPEDPERNELIDFAEGFFDAFKAIDLGQYGAITACAGTELFVWRDTDSNARLIRRPACNKLLRLAQQSKKDSENAAPQELIANRHLDNMHQEATSFLCLSAENKLEFSMEKKLNMQFECEFSEGMIR